MLPWAGSLASLGDPESCRTPRNTPSAGPGRLWFSVPLVCSGLALLPAGLGEGLRPGKGREWPGGSRGRQAADDLGLFWAVPAECGRGRAEVTEGRNNY